MSDTLKLARQLIQQRSITPEDAGCQELIASRLEKLGFSIEPMPFGEVNNLWARLGTATPLFCFAGHTDVVPPGPETEWDFPPFSADLSDGMLFGRGAADMKGSLAAMVTATERFLADQQQPSGSIAFLITSDEEGDAVDGTVKVIETLEARGERIDWCLVGEPSSENRVGDTIKNGRRGSLGGTLRILGVQGHVAYPHLAKNPVHMAAPVLAQLVSMEWDQGNEDFPPTSFQIANINAGTGASNVIPGELEVQFNFRYSTETTHQRLMQEVETLLSQYDLDLDYQLDWNLSGKPFLTRPGELTLTAQQAIREVTGQESQLSTSGGTSDGRFIAPTGAQVIELGPVNETIHKVNECVSVSDLDQLSLIYQRILTGLLSGSIS